MERVEMHLIDAVRFNEQGLVPAIAQDAASGDVLMMAWMNRDTLAETIEKGVMVYFSRSRRARWLKGETSGHTQRVKELFIDCDGDTLLFKVDQTGAACHEHYFSCFFRKSEGAEWRIVRKKITE
jgi:phosphoribosyl-AMP cyclohydrolase